MNTTDALSDGERLCIQRFVPASPARVFNAWTEAEAIRKWWGPEGVSCVAAEIDLRVNGEYRIGNELPDGSILWISGIFEVIEKPHLLIYSWVVEDKNPATERVEIQFTPKDAGTDITITHERIATSHLREQHQRGWLGCLNGLGKFLGQISDRSVTS